MLMARESFDKVIGEIKRDIMKMGDLAGEAVAESVKSLKEQDIELADKVIKDEDKSDLLNLSVEERCINLMALQQPVAKDLRILATAMRISNNYERVCDLAGKIAEITKKIGKSPLAKPLVDIPKISELIQEIIVLNNEAIAKWSIAPTEGIQDKENEIDAIYARIHTDLVDLMRRKPEVVENAADLFFVARFLERIGDVVAKTGARIVYMIEGTRIWIK